MRHERAAEAGRHLLGRDLAVAVDVERREHRGEPPHSSRVMKPSPSRSKTLKKSRAACAGARLVAAAPGSARRAASRARRSPWRTRRCPRRASRCAILSASCAARNAASSIVRLRDVHRRAPSRDRACARACLRSSRELGEQVRRDRQQVAAGELDDLAEVAEARAHDLGLVAVLLVVVVDLRHRHARPDPRRAR